MRFLLGLFMGGFAGFAGGLVVMLVIFPFLFPPPMVNELVEEAGASLVDESLFRQNVDGHDPAHWGRGDLKVYRDGQGNYLVELQANFEVGPGPNFWIYLNGAPDIDDEADFNADGDRLRITKLKSFQGSQVYEIPAADYEGARALTIWCESFGQYIASANLG